MTSTLQAVQHDSELGQWEFVFGKPRPSLAAYVNHYQGYIERHTGFQRRREYPRSSSSIILNLGGPLRIANPVTGESVDQATSFGRRPWRLLRHDGNAGTLVRRRDQLHAPRCLCLPRHANRHLCRPRLQPQ